MTPSTDGLPDQLQLQFDAFFDDAVISYDLREGLLWNSAKTRVCLLSTDLLSGAYKALVDEAGPAWSMIFKNCGQIWGNRVVKRLDRECQLLLGKQLGELPLGQFLPFLTQYFVFHGWGVLELDVSRARELGVVEATLKHSIFADIVTDAEEMADPMICGILASIISYLSGHKVDCVQTQCATKGDECSRFLLTDPDRLKTVESGLKSGLSHERLLETV